MITPNSLRVALVGCGRISLIHINALRDLPGVSIVAVCDLDEEVARERASKNGIKRFYTDMEAMMKEEWPDVVHLLTPPRTHLGLAKIAAKYGAHMYIEKPLASNESEARAILEAARESGAKICPGHSRVFDPPFLEACKRIAAGEIGKVISVHAEQGFTYEAAARSAVMPWSYTYDWGVFENLMPHPLSMVCRFLEEPGLPQVVGFNLGRVRESAIEEVRVLIPAKNAVGEISLSLCNSPEVNRLEVVGTRGRIQVDFNTLTVLSTSQSGLPSAVVRFTSNLNTALQLTRSTLAVASGIVTGKVKRYMGLRNLVAEFYRSLQEGVAQPVAAEEGLLNVCLMDQIRSVCQSAAKQRIEAQVPTEAASAPRFLVTGASGFLGGRLVDLLSADGAAARATTRLLGRARPLPGIEWVQCDLGREDELRRALAGVETVFHCAALAGPPGTQKEYEEANVAGTIRLARLAAEAGVKNLVYMSSLSVYGMPPGSDPNLDESAPYDERAADRGLYTQTKLAAEIALLEYAREHAEPRITMLRAGTIYGPGANIPFGRLQLPSPGNRPIIAGSRRVPMPLIYVDNLVDALRAAARSETPTGRVYNVVDSPEDDQGAVAEALRSVTNGRVQLRFLPYPLVWLMMCGFDLLSLVRNGKPGTARYRLKRTVADMRYPCLAAREDLGWRPRISLLDGLSRTIESADLPTGTATPKPEKMPIPAHRDWPRESDPATIAGSERAAASTINVGTSMIESAAVTPATQGAAR